MGSEGGSAAFNSVCPTGQIQCHLTTCRTLFSQSFPSLSVVSLLSSFPDPWPFLSSLLQWVLVFVLSIAPCSFHPLFLV